MGTSTRISEMSRYNAVLDRVAQARQKLDTATEIASSGMRIKQVSDDPTAFVNILQNREKIANMTQYKRNIDLSKGFLAKTEGALRGMLETLSRAKELAIQQASETYEGKDRKVTAMEVKELALHLVALGNETYNDRYIFGGFQTRHPPLTEDGRYLGDDGQIFIQIDEGRFQPLNVNGRELFGASSGENGSGPTRLVSLLTKFYDALIDNSKEGIQASLSDLDDGFQSVLAMVASVGARGQAMEKTYEKLGWDEIQAQTNQRNLGEADMMKSALDLRKMENTLQFTLQASSKMLTPSLIDFLK